MIVERYSAFAGEQDMPEWADKVIDKILDFCDYENLTTEYLISEMKLTNTTVTNCKEPSDLFEGATNNFYVFEFTWDSDAEKTLFMLKWG